MNSIFDRFIELNTYTYTTAVSGSFVIISVDLFTTYIYSCSVHFVSLTIIFSHGVLSFVLVYSNEALASALSWRELFEMLTVWLSHWMFSENDFFCQWISPLHDQPSVVPLSLVQLYPKGFACCNSLSFFTWQANPTFQGSTIVCHPTSFKQDSKLKVIVYHAW